MRNPKRLTAAVILVLAALLAPLSGHATDGQQAPYTDPRYGNCRYGQASQLAGLQICAKITIYTGLGFGNPVAQSRHLINFAGHHSLLLGSSLPGGSYQFTLTKKVTVSGVTTIYPILNESGTFSPSLTGAFSVERVSAINHPNALNATLNNPTFTATTRLTVGTHTDTVSQVCRFGDPDLTRTALCVGTVPSSPYV